MEVEGDGGRELFGRYIARLARRLVISAGLSMSLARGKRDKVSAVSGIVRRKLRMVRLPTRFPVPMKLVKKFLGKQLLRFGLFSIL